MALNKKDQTLIRDYAREVRGLEAERGDINSKIAEVYEAAEESGLDREALKETVRRLRKQAKLGNEQYMLAMDMADEYFNAAVPAKPRGKGDEEGNLLGTSH